MGRAAKGCETLDLLIGRHHALLSLHGRTADVQPHGLGIVRACSLGCQFFALSSADLAQILSWLAVQRMYASAPALLFGLFVLAKLGLCLGALLQPKVTAHHAVVGSSSMKPRNPVGSNRQGSHPGRLCAGLAARCKLRCCAGHERYATWHVALLLWAWPALGVGGVVHQSP